VTACAQNKKAAGAFLPLESDKPGLRQTLFVCYNARQPSDATVMARFGQPLAGVTSTW
jgi:hypothetical protein